MNSGIVSDHERIIPNTLGNNVLRVKEDENTCCVSNNISQELLINTWFCGESVCS